MPFGEKVLRRESPSPSSQVSPGCCHVLHMLTWSSGQVVVMPVGTCLPCYSSFHAYLNRLFPSARCRFLLLFPSHPPFQNLAVRGRQHFSSIHLAQPARPSTQNRGFSTPRISCPSTQHLSTPRTPHRATGYLSTLKTSRPSTRYPPCPKIFSPSPSAPLYPRKFLALLLDICLLHHRPLTKSLDLFRHYGPEVQQQPSSSSQVRPCSPYRQRGERHGGRETSAAANLGGTGQRP